MIKIGSSKALGDYYIELEAHMRSCTLHNLYALDGEIPQAKLAVHSTDIIPLCEFEWYEWIMFIDKDQTYHSHWYELGCWFGPVIDIQSAVTYSDLKSIARLYLAPKSVV